MKLRLSDLDFKEKTVKIGQEKVRAQFHRIVPIPSSLFWEVMERYSRRIASKDDLLFPISERQARNIVS